MGINGHGSRCERERKIHGLVCYICYAVPSNVCIRSLCFGLLPSCGKHGTRYMKFSLRPYRSCVLLFHLLLCRVLLFRVLYVSLSSNCDGRLLNYVNYKTAIPRSVPSHSPFCSFLSLCDSIHFVNSK